MSTAGIGIISLRKRLAQSTQPTVASTALSIQRLTGIVYWNMGKKPRHEHFAGFIAIDGEMIRFIARQMARRHGLARAAVALLHAVNLSQRAIGEVLGIDHSTVSRRLKDYLDVHRRSCEREE